MPQVTVGREACICYAFAGSDPLALQEDGMPDNTDAGPSPTQPGSAEPPRQRNSNRRLWVVIIVLVVSLLCFCGVTGGLILAGSLLEDDAQDSTTGTERQRSSAEGAADESGPESVPPTLDEVRAEAERMVEHFYPDCELQSLSEISGREGTATYDIVVSYLTTPGFRFVIRADRSDGDWALYEPDSPSGEYVDEESGALWYHDKLGAGIYALLGSDGLFTDYTAPAMTQAYAELHPGRLVMHFAATSRVEVEYASIAEDELAGWDGVAWTHESTWTNDLASNTWIQVGESTDG